MRTKFLIILGCVLAALPAFGAEKQIWAKSFLNQKAPKFEAEKWLTTVPNCKGKFVLIDFWATWCGPCREAITELNTLHKRFGDKLVVIGLSDEPEADVKKMTSPKIDYFVAIDTQARMKKAVEVEGIPHVLILDLQGIVRWEGFPLMDGFELTEKVVAGILAKSAFTNEPKDPFSFVDGEVKAPGRPPGMGRVTVLKAIQSRGDFTDFADKKKVRLIHPDGRTEIIDCVKAMDHPELDLEVYPGDKIHVPRKVP